MKKIKPALILSYLILALFIHINASNIPCEWKGVKKIIAVGDIHGDYRNLVIILKGTGIIDAELHWTGGKTHLVQTGDIMDRGPDAKKVFDLLKKLEKEAEEAGGKVHMLIGNHEEMNITGTSIDYPGYVTVEQFISFLPDKYREKKEREFRKKFEENAGNEIESDSSLDVHLKNSWIDVMKKSREARRKYVQTFNDTYGNWITEHNAVIKINDIIFVHGGISEEFSQWKLEDINDRLRLELNDFRIAIKRHQPPTYKRKIVYARNGPLWYRGFAQEDEELFKNDVERILNCLNAKYMVIAHTPQIGSKIISEEYMSRFQGKIWIIDTGISEAYNGFLSALIIENGNFSLWGEGNEK